MSLWQRLNNSIWSAVNYIRPTRPAPQNIEQGEMVSLVTELEQESSLPEPSTEVVSTYQIIKSVTELLLAPANRGRVTAATALTFVEVGLNFVSPWVFSQLIQSLATEEGTVTIGNVKLSRTALIIMWVGSSSLSQIIPNLREQLLAPVTTNNNQIVKERNIKQILEQSQYYHLNIPIGDMITQIQKGEALSQAGALLASKIGPSVIEITAACAALSSLYGIEVGLSLMTLLAVYGVYGYSTVKPIIKIREQHLDATNAAWTIIFDTIRRHPLMQLCDQTERDQKEIHKILSQLTDVETRIATVPLKIDLGFIQLPRLNMLFAALFVGLGVQPGRYTVQQFTVLATYFAQLSNSLPGFGKALNQLLSLYPDIKFVCNAQNQPNTVVDLYPNVPLVTSPPETPPIEAQPFIEFKNVSFNYPGKPPVFTNLSFQVFQGQKVALISKSGIGKTTAFNLIFKHYAPTKGTIEINGQDISKVGLKSLRSKISFFGQSALLFPGTVRTNICYGAENPGTVTDELIWETARAAGLHDFLTKVGLDKEVGEQGKMLSGGEQQKVAVLRGLMKKAPIRLYDEITASLDVESAAFMLKSLKDTSTANTTSFTVTHKLSEITEMDVIIVLSEGAAIAQGTHSELLETCTLYQELWESYSTTRDPEATPSAQSAAQHGIFASPASSNGTAESPITATPRI